MTKTTEEVLIRAVQLQGDFTAFMERLVAGFGDTTDELRVFGHLCQAGADFAQANLERLRLKDEQDKKIILAN